METKHKTEYIKAWHDHIDSMGALVWTPNRELSKEVGLTLDKLKELVVKVADDKQLKEVEA